MPYDPDGAEPDTDKRIFELKNGSGLSGFDHARVVLGPPESSARLNVAEKRFSCCDFRGSIEKASFTKCEFLGCYFTGTHWKMVKFSRCRFQKCHFLHTDFLDCRFLECEFARISVSADHFRCETTEIDVTTFLAGVTTNLNYLPPNVPGGYQTSRLVRDKAKLARILYRSNQELFGRQFFAAHKELIVYSILADIEEQRFEEIRPRSVPKRRRRASFLCRTFMSFIDLRTVQAAGGLTKWGQSIARPLFFILGVMFLFALLYLYIFNLKRGEAILRSLDVSFVAGYTGHIPVTDSPALRITTLINLMVGIYWYSLIVPVITRKFLR